MENAGCTGSLEHGRTRGLAWDLLTPPGQVLGSELPSLHPVTHATLYPPWGSGHSHEEIRVVYMPMRLVM